VIGSSGEAVVEISWVTNPGRGDRFEEFWRPVAEAALDYGASAQMFIRSTEDPALFKQYSAWPDKLTFERYWISEEVSEARAQVNGLYGLPVLPVWHTVVAAAETEPATAE
jgi:hypothetical protein